MKIYKSLITAWLLKKESINVEFRFDGELVEHESILFMFYSQIIKMSLRNFSVVVAGDNNTHISDKHKELLQLLDVISQDVFDADYTKANITTHEHTLIELLTFDLFSAWIVYTLEKDVFTHSHELNTCFDIVNHDD